MLCVNLKPQDRGKRAWKAQELAHASGALYTQQSATHAERHTQESQTEESQAEAHNAEPNEEERS